MDELALAPGATAVPQHPAHYPPWCTEPRPRSAGTVLHRSTPVVVALYDEACELLDAQVRAAFWHKTSDWIGTDPADIERPHVEVCIATGSTIPLYLNPGQARAFAAALVRAADAADTEALHQPPALSSMASAVTTGTVAPRQA